MLLTNILEGNTMYTQFFGNYLFSSGYVTKEQLLPALLRHTHEVLRVSTLALYKGYMSAQEIDFVINMQKEQGRKFSELAIEQGLLSQTQVLELLNLKAPDFLTLGQTLIDDGAFTYEQFENILADYRSQHEFLEMELNEANKSDIQLLIDSFSIVSESAIPVFGKSYLELLFNNFVRYIGDDFTALPASVCTEFATEHCVAQSIHGNYIVNTYLAMDEASAIAFAGRYSGEIFDRYDEYVEAALEDFLNLHNGLFIVNASNERSNELTLGILEHKEETILNFDTHPTFLFSVYYPFGMIHFIMEVVQIYEP